MLDSDESRSYGEDREAPLASSPGRSPRKAYLVRGEVDKRGVSLMEL